MEKRELEYVAAYGKIFDEGRRKGEELVLEELKETAQQWRKSSEHIKISILLQLIEEKLENIKNSN